MSKPAMPQPAVYYVAYSHPLGFGAMDITMPKPIRTTADVWTLFDAVQRQHPNAVVLNYQLINPPATVDPALIAALATAARQDLTTGRNAEQVLTTLLTALDHTSR